MSKLKLIIKREYLAKVRNKSFIIMTFLSPILMVGMVVLIAFLTKINDGDKRIIAVYNESDYLSNEFKPTETISFVKYRSLNKEQAMDSTIAMGYYGLLHIPKEADLEETLANTFLYTKENPVSSVVERLERVFENRLRQDKLQKIGVSSKEFSKIEQAFDLKTATYKGEENVKGLNMMKAFVGGAFGYLIMMFIIIYGGFVMRSVIEEKTSRIIEVIISSVKPFQLMLGKIIGTSLAGLTQFAIWIFSASLLLIVALLVLDIDLGVMASNPALTSNPMIGMPTPQESEVEITKTQQLLDHVGY